MRDVLDPRQYAYRNDIAALDLKGKVKSERFVEGTLYQVGKPSAPVNGEPRHDVYMMTEALYGERVRVFESRDGWAWGQLERDRYVGYIPQDALVLATTPATHCVAALRTYIFPDPDIKLPPSALLSMGAEVSIVEHTGMFARLGNDTYIFAQHLVRLDEFATDYVEIAQMLLGAPYRWGGKQSLGLDCSGLVQVALQRAGIHAPRDSDLQEAELGHVLDDTGDLQQVKRGDFVFWKGHVGIMLDEERLLHANGHHMATAIEPLETAAARIAAGGSHITSLKRLSL